MTRIVCPHPAAALSISRRPCLARASHSTCTPASLRMLQFFKAEVRLRPEASRDGSGVSEKRSLPLPAPWREAIQIGVDCYGGQPDRRVPRTTSSAHACSCPIARGPCRRGSQVLSFLAFGIFVGTSRDVRQILQS